MGEETESKRTMACARTGTVIDVVTIKGWLGNSSLGKTKLTAKRPVGPSPVTETRGETGGGLAPSDPPDDGAGASENGDTKLEA
jgi:hypothetical protein